MIKLPDEKISVPEVNSSRHKKLRFDIILSKIYFNSLISDTNNDCCLNKLSK